MNFLCKTIIIILRSDGDRSPTCSCQKRGGSNGFTKTHLDMRKNYTEKWRMSDDLRGEKKNNQLPILPLPPPTKKPQTPATIKPNQKNPPKHKHKSSQLPEQ